MRDWVCPQPPASAPLLLWALGFPFPIPLLSEHPFLRPLPCAFKPLPVTGLSGMDQGELPLQAILVALAAMQGRSFCLSGGRCGVVVKLQTFRHWKQNPNHLTFYIPKTVACKAFQGDVSKCQFLLIQQGETYQWSVEICFPNGPQKGLRQWHFPHICQELNLMNSEELQAMTTSEFQYSRSCWLHED